LVSACSKELPPGKIRDSNKIMLKTLLQEQGIASKINDYGVVSDTYEELDAALKKATHECSLVVTSGGVSMGEKDLVKPCLEENGTIIFGRLNMKPGKPTTIATVGNSLVFALPGNPVSSFVTANLFVIPVARHLSGRP